MKTNMRAADELGWIRAEIGRLKAREGALRDRLITQENAREGLAFAVHVRTQTRRVFQKNRLPADILDNPAFWEVRTSPVVTVKPRATRSAPDTGGDDADFNVIERF